MRWPTIFTRSTSSFRPGAGDTAVQLRSIRPHLRPYSIVQRRRTTINHAFASALAPCSAFDEQTLRRAMAALGQTDLQNLRCVYCDVPAETWDHLVGLVKNSELNGYGHQIGNLVPCCRACNSLKGNHDWREFVTSRVSDQTRRDRLTNHLATYLDTFASPIDMSRMLSEYPEEWTRYNEVKREIVELMAEADRLAATLRLPVA